MVFPIVGGNESKGTQQNSLRFNNDDSAYLSRTPSSEGNRKTSTFSGWFKRGSVTDSGILFEARIDNDNRFDFRFDGTKILVYGEISNTEVVYLATSALFRDPAAWYHLVFVVDTTQGTQSNRVKLYVNGSQVTSFSTSTNNLSSNQDTPINTTNAHSVGANTSGGGPYDGYMADIHFIDGTAKAPTDFGETNSNGVWIPKDYDGSYGTNGYRLEFQETGTSQNATGIGADTSGQDNHLAVTNLAATDITTDSPTNNFCTLNPLYKQGSPTFSEGNCKVVLPAGDGTQGAAGGIAPANGKWYWEVKHVSSTNSSIMVREASDREDYLSYYQGNYAGYEKNDGDQNVTGNTTSTYGASYSDGDIIMVALDMDNDRVYFGKNGSWNDGSGNADEANLSDYVSLSGVVNGLAAVANANGSATATFEMNFGNPSFAISSSNADANGYGNFEYAVPNSYYSLCTKNLAEFG